MLDGEGLVDRYGCLNELGVYLYASLVDTGIQGEESALEVGDREAAEPLVYMSLSLNVTDRVLFELRPLLRGVVRQVSGPSAVCDGRLARLAEVVDEVPALLELLLL